MGLHVTLHTLRKPHAWMLGVVLLAMALLRQAGLRPGMSAADRKAGIGRWMVLFGLLPRGLPGLVFATTTRSVGVIDPVPFSALC